MSSSLWNASIASLKRLTPAQSSWFWLAAGVLLLPFTAWQTVVPIAGWLAPIVLLRFSRTARPKWLAQRLLFLVCAGSILIGNRGMPFSLLGLIGNVVVKGLAWSLVYAADRWLSGRLKGWLRTLAFPLSFATMEWALSFTPIANSGSPAYSQTGSLALLQLLSVTGLWGVTFLITWCASVANELWERGSDWRSARGLAVAFVAALLVVFLAGGARLAFAPSPSRTVAAATVTGTAATIEAATKPIDWLRGNWSTEAQRAALRPGFSRTVDQMLARTETALEGGATLVAWQESAAWVLVEDQRAVIDRAAALARGKGAYLALSMEVLTGASKLPVLRNEAILVGPAGSVLWIYDKQDPNPYDEAFATIRGRETLPLADTPFGRLSTAICYDTYYPALVRQAGRRDADVLVEPANDSKPFAESAAEMATYRCIENGFSMLRPTGNGISAMIDRQGRFLARQVSSTDDGGVMMASLPVLGRPTIYSRIGDAFPCAGAAALAALVVATLLRRKSSLDAPR
ncbi:MAG TPA: nitrilase-related carbon-nitrogen hydrolase [Spirochaetia bacterium]|nr:nitrilase-related carbon-nitrogen hydrolase [Spirochaetia bacterium]